MAKALRKSGQTLCNQTTPSQIGILARERYMCAKILFSWAFEDSNTTMAAARRLLFEHSHGLGARDAAPVLDGAQLFPEYKGCGLAEDFDYSLGSSGS
jgi:hypothetical protein